MKKVFITGFIFVSLIGLYVMAQSPAPVASATPAVVAVAHPSGLQALVDSKGGLVPFLLLIMFSANSLLTAIRQVLLKWDNIAPGDTVPADAKALTFFNKVSVIVGKILDFMMANPQH